MVVAREAHDVAILAPWYATGQEGVAIHRYLDPGFIPQFQADVSNAPQDNVQLFAWQQEDRMPAPDSRLKLRRPVHRTFHIVAWEASCILPTAPRGVPAIAPEKIASAGFVLRDVSAANGASPAAPKGFQLLKGKPIGWTPIHDPKADADAVRHVKSLALVPRKAAPSPGYTGEETFPLHPLSVMTGATPHTLLYGYLPIGGGDYVPQTEPAPDTSEAAEDLPWPVGMAGYSKGPPKTYTADHQIVGGVIRPPLAALLRVLLGRYQLVDPTAWDPNNANSTDNLALIAILYTINFFPEPPSPLGGDALREWAAANALPGVTLGSMLKQWTAAGTPSGDSLGALVSSNSPAQTLLSKLNDAYPNGTVELSASNGLPDFPYGLLVLESTAAKLRDALRQRLAQAISASSSALPVAKLTSGPSGSYVVVPFVRTICPNGCEKISWGSPSEPFAIAALFDTDAARPTLIEMPDLDDARKGFARGATFKLPPKLADLANGLSTSSAVNALWNSGKQPSGGLGIGYICSFSLPAISICAMLMLSIVLCLLNIFLGWMAWVKICLPIPVKK